MKLIIHTGHGKTGSSSIQATLKNNVKELGQNKIFYVGLSFELSPFKKFDWQKAYGWPELKSLSQSDFNEQLYMVVATTLNELKAQGYKVIIWSNESLFVNVEKLKSVFEKLAADFDVETISFIRRHDKWLRSAYLQWGVKHKAYFGGVKSFAEWAKDGVNFSGKMLKWQSLKGIKCSFINFEECGDVSDAFFKLLDLEYRKLSSSKVNETPSNVELAMFALYNSLFRGPKMPNDLQVLLNKYKVKTLLEHDLNIKDIFPNEDQLNNVVQNCNNDANKVNEIFKSQGQPIFDFEDNIKNKNVPDITSEKMIAVLIHIVNEQNNKIDSLNQSVEKLREGLTK
jgi:hypothetical protein